jgi:GT2 family glycosyltransferase
VVSLPGNVGFGRAVNIGVASHPGNPVVLVNNDAICEPRFVEALLDEATDTDAIAGVLRQNANPDLIDSAGVIADKTLLAFDYLHGRPVADAGRAPPPLGPTGGAAMFPLEAFNRLGGFDERMFAYLEDVDLALRAHAAGIGCKLASSALAVHKHSSTLGAGSAAKNRLMGTSRGYMLHRYRVMAEPRRALRALLTEVAICGGQLLIDHTTSGITGRITGWGLARGVPPRALPEAGLVDMPLRRALGIRFARSRGSRQLNCPLPR